MAFKAGALTGTASLNPTAWLNGLKKMLTSTKAFAAIMTGAAVLAIIKMTKETNEYLKALANVSTLVDTNVVDMSEMSKGILALNSALGPAKELTEGMYQALSAGVDAAYGVEFVGEAAMFARAALTDTFTAVDVLTTALNAYGMASEQVTEISDLFFETIRLGKVTGEELASTIGASIPIFASAGLSLTELSVGVATLTKQGTNAANATTLLNRIVASFLKPSEELTQVLSDLGYESGAAFLKAEGLAGALSLVEQYAEGDASAMAELFPNIRALRGAMALTGNGAEIFAETMAEMTDVAGATALAFSKQELTFETLKNAMNKAMITIGLQFFETTSDMITDLTLLVDEFTVWAMTTETIGNAIDGLMGVVSLAVTIFGELMGVLEPLVSEIFLLLYDQTGNVKDIFEALAPILLTFISNIVIPLSQLVSQLSDVLNNLFETLRTSGIIENLQFIGDALSFIVGLRMEILFAKVAAAVNIFSMAVEFVLDILDPWIGLVKTAVESLSGFYDQFSKNTLLEDMGKGFESIHKGLKVFTTFISLFLGPSFETLSEVITVGLGWITDKATELIKNIKNAAETIIGFATGLLSSAEAAALLSDALNFVLNYIYIVIQGFELGLQGIQSFASVSYTVLTESFSAIGDAARFAFNPRNWLLSPEEFLAGLVAPFDGVGEEIAQKVNEEFAQVKDEFNDLFDEEQRENFVASGRQAITDFTEGVTETLEEARDIVNASYAEMEADAEEHTQNTFDLMEETQEEAQEILEDTIDQQDEVLNEILEAYDEYLLTTFEGARDNYAERQQLLDNYYAQGKLTEAQYQQASQAAWDTYYSAVTARVDQYVSTATGVIGSMVGSISSLTSTYYATELNKLDKKQQEEMALLENNYTNGVISEEEYEKQKTAIDEKYARKTDQIKEKQFNAEKKLSIANVWIDLASAIMGFWSAYGGIPFVGAALAGALTTIATGVAIAQTAMISQQEYVPSAQEGAEVTKTGYIETDEYGAGEIKRYPEGTVIYPHDISMGFASMAAQLFGTFGGSGDTYNINIENAAFRSEEDMDELLDYMIEELGRRRKLAI
jgi:TP901 family phage tail tape measure protein